jgi:hypothetical protein
MQPTIYREQTICPLRPSPKPTFKVFLACEDEAALFQARKVQDQVEVLCRVEFRVACLFWHFALFRHESLRELAVREADAAAMIVISLHGNNELPPTVKSWVEGWPARPHRGQAALVTLVGPEEEGWPERQPQVAYLRQMAEHRGLDFLCNQDGWERVELSKSLFPGMKVRLATPEDAFTLPTPWLGGGINE